MKHRWYYWTLLGFSSLQFGAVGLLKVAGFAPLYQQLAELHISHGLGLFIGLAEVTGVLGLWVRRTRGWALLGLLTLAVCAVAVHFGAGVALTKAVPAVLAAGVLTTLLYLTNPPAARGLVNGGLADSVSAQ